MRKVQIFTWSRNPDQPNKYDKIDNGTGTFHQFSSGYEEFENGPGNYAVAIVERDDGTVETVPADLIRFIDPIKPTSGADVRDGLVTELQAAEKIILVMLKQMTTSQKLCMAAELEEQGVSEDGATRYHERRAALTKAGAA